MNKELSMKKLNSIEEKILDSTLHLMGTIGSTKVPIRAIAKEAGVNVAAINYYFGTKEELIHQTYKFYVDNTKEIFKILDQYEYSIEERLVLIANEVMEYTMRYSGLAIILNEAGKLKEVDTVAKEVYDISASLYRKLYKLLEQILGGEPRLIEYKFTIFISSIIYPIDNSRIHYSKDHIFSNREKRIDYIKYLISSLR